MSRSIRIDNGGVVRCSKAFARCARFWLAIITTTLAVGLGAGASSGASPPKGVTGNAAAIALYTKAVAKVNASPVQVQVTHGAYWFQYGASWSLTWNRSTSPSPMSFPVDVSEVYASARGRIVSEHLTFANACSVLGACQTIWLQFSFGALGPYWSVRGKPGSMCWNHATGATAWIPQNFNSVGSKTWYVGGNPNTSAPHYDPIVRHGGIVLITSTYSFTDGQKVAETDVINLETTLFVKTTVRVQSGKTANEPAYWYSTTINYPRTTPKPPSLNLCSNSG